MNNYYNTLRVPRQATAQQLKHAYRCLVKIYHPDLFATGSKERIEAEERIREINVAYSIVSKTLSQDGYQAQVTVDHVRTAHAQTVPKPEHCSRCGRVTGYWQSVARSGALCPACKGE